MERRNQVDRQKKYLMPFWDLLSPSKRKLVVFRSVQPGLFMNNLNRNVQKFLYGGKRCPEKSKEV